MTDGEELPKMVADSANGLGHWAGNHLSVEETLAYSRGNLTDVPLEAARSHLESCGTCRDRIADVRALFTPIQVDERALSNQAADRMWSEFLQAHRPTNGGGRAWRYFIVAAATVSLAGVASLIGVRFSGWQGAGVGETWTKLSVTLTPTVVPGLQVPRVGALGSRSGQATILKRSASAHPLEMKLLLNPKALNISINTFEESQYAAVIRNSRGQKIWTQYHVRMRIDSDANVLFSVDVPSNMLSEGTFLVILSDASRGQDIAGYALKVIKNFGEMREAPAAEVSSRPEDLPHLH